MDWELYELWSKKIGVKVEDNRIKVFGGSQSKFYAARVIIDGKVGFASAEDPKNAIEFAKKVAKISNEELEDFPCEKPSKVSGIYDRRVEDLTVDYLREEVERLLSSAEKISTAEISHEVSEVRITNSYGCEVEERSSFSSLNVEVVIDNGSGYDFFESRSVELRIEDVAEKAEELAKLSAKSKRVERKISDIILSPYAVHQLFSNTLYPSLSAENVLKGRSRLKIGDCIGNLKIIDDSTIDGGLMSCSFDDEGCAGRRKVIVDENIVNFFTDWKTAKIFGCTGNGFREDATTPPAPSPSNVILDVKEKCDLDDAIYINYFTGAHTANPVSGDFSYECHNATLNGEPVRMMIYGNVFELLNKLAGKFGEAKQVENTITPALRFESVRLI